MKKLMILICAGVLMSSVCAGFTACNDDNGNGGPGESGLGVEIPGMETYDATGIIIGAFADTGFGSFLVQVDEEYPIGESLEHITNPWITLPEEGMYPNMIQVQHKLPVGIGNRISFSIRKYNKQADHDLFIIGTGLVTADHSIPGIPICVITDYELLN